MNAANRGVNALQARPNAIDSIGSRVVNPRRNGNEKAALSSAASVCEIVGDADSR